MLQNLNIPSTHTHTPSTSPIYESSRVDVCMYVHIWRAFKGESGIGSLCVFAHQLFAPEERAQRRNNAKWAVRSGKGDGDAGMDWSISNHLNAFAKLLRLIAVFRWNASEVCKKRKCPADNTHAAESAQKRFAPVFWSLLQIQTLAPLSILLSPANRQCLAESVSVLRS